MFQVVWSSVVHVLWCYPGSVVYNSPTLSLLVPGLLSLPELLRLSPLHSFNFHFKVSIFDSFSVTLTEVFFSVAMVISMSRQLSSCLFLITMSGLLPLSYNLSALAYPTRLWYCLFLLLFGAHSFLFIFNSFFCNWLLELCSPYSSIFANFWTYLKVVCEMWLQFVLYFL